MKFSIGDIIDRLTICKLKSERLSIDNSQEIFELSNEMNSYDDTINFYNDLYEINSKIWDLESDIRKGNEDILGLEEVGRRALKIRELNNLRVNLKNQINSKFEEGFIEVKMNHGSEKIPDVVISLTTVPERLSNISEDGIINVIKHLCEQDYEGYYEVHFNIPEVYSMTNEPYIIPNWINYFKLKYPHLKIFRTADFGPPTKFVPTIMRIENPETIVLTVDDDLIYHPEMVSEHKKYQDLLGDSVVCYEGRGCEKILYGGDDIRDSWILCVPEIRETHGLQHFKSASYKVKLFDQDFYKDYLGKTFSDDVLVSIFFRNKRIKMYVVPYEKDMHLFETRELWDKNQGVVTFPINSYASSVENTGCNHPEILKIQPKFYEPKNLYSIKNSEIFDTDKISHGYMEIYSPIFLSKKNAKKILEIGVYHGGGLKLLSHYFNEAIVYGIDINEIDMPAFDNIKTFVYNQEDRENLQDLIDLIGEDFDLILDDGGHTMKQQQISFGFLFEKLKSGGIYIIENLHTSRLDGFSTDDDKVKTLDMLHVLQNQGKLFSNHILDQEKDYIENNFESIKIWTCSPSFDKSVTSIITKK
jgi:hypothetical protein